LAWLLEFRFKQLLYLVYSGDRAVICVGAAEGIRLLEANA